MDEVPEANKVSVLKDVEIFYTKLIRKDDCILSIMYSDKDSEKDNNELFKKCGMNK